MCQMLLSIKPQFVASILSGQKKYEYRKFRCREDVDKIVIYSTAPVKRVVAEVDIIEIVEDSVEVVWKKTKEHSGISKDFFDHYYEGKKRAFAYHLGEMHVYDKPKLLQEIGVSYPPQSFCYLASGGADKI